MRIICTLLCAVSSLAAGSARAADLPTQDAIRSARDKVFPALVHIQAVSSYYKDGQKVQSVSAGSGAIIDRNGHVVTNYHVVGRADSIKCTLSDKRQVSAKRVGGDPWTDLAVIRINKKELRGRKIAVAEFGKMSKVEAGDYVMAMGSPLSLSRSISLGIVSCADRYLPGGYRLPSGEPTGLFNTWIQTDAAINPGNSGGPLVNLDGKIVGVNTRGVIKASNIGFAIPVDVVKKVTAALVRHRRVVRSWIGVRLQPLKGVGGAAQSNAKEGVVISGVEDNSPAEAAGLRPGDILLAFDGKPVNAVFLEGVPAVYRLIAETKLGKTATLKVARNGKTIGVKVKTELLGAARAANKQIAALGLVIRNITTEDVRAQNLPNRIGALVQSVSKTGPAGTAGIKTGDIIIEMDRQPVKSANDLVRIYRKVPKKKTRVLARYRRGFSVNFALIRKGT
jgi:serine protease Do